MPTAGLFLWQVLNEERRDGRAQVIDWGKDTGGFEFEASERRFMCRRDAAERTLEWMHSPKKWRGVAPTAFVICRIPDRKGLKHSLKFSQLPGMRFWFCVSPHDKQDSNCLFQPVQWGTPFLNRLQEMDNKGLKRSRHCYMVHETE
jgi:hypothetical protein